MSVRVKICGITNSEDAQVAVEAGADALGFIFFSQSPRNIPSAEAKRIIEGIPPFVAKVGVFVNEGFERILQIAKETGIDTVQLHGDELPELCEKIARENLKVIKAFRIKDGSSLGALMDFRVSALLLDSYVPGQLGGTGAKFNWDLAVRAKDVGTPIILAGGLVPENVRDAISKVAPYGVDVSSGVESAAGRKDHAKVRAFIGAAHFSAQR
jgi:phosphoribosylanthranilate isomerase